MVFATMRTRSAPSPGSMIWTRRRDRRTPSSRHPAISCSRGLRLPGSPATEPTFPGSRMAAGAAATETPRVGPAARRGRPATTYPNDSPRYCAGDVRGERRARPLDLRALGARRLQFDRVGAPRDRVHDRRWPRSGQLDGSGRHGGGLPTWLAERVGAVPRTRLGAGPRHVRWQRGNTLQTLQKETTLRRGPFLGYYREERYVCCFFCLWEVAGIRRRADD